MTSNVEGFDKASPINVLTRLAQEKPDVIMLTEDTTRTAGALKAAATTLGYHLACSCRAEILMSATRNTVHLRNTILVRKGITTENMKCGDIHSAGQTHRTFCGVTLKLGRRRIPIVATHLLGGRYESVQFLKHVRGREKQLQKIVNAYSPVVIAGDFNAFESAAMARKAYANYPPYQKQSTEHKKMYLEYSTNGHEFLSASGYKKAYTAQEIGATSYYNGAMDWVYFRPGLLRAKGSKNVEMMNGKRHPQNCSGCLTDHNAVVVDFAVL